MNDLENILEKFNDNKIILIGDFNGHIKEIGKQNENYNGKIMKNVASRHNLEILNLSEKCKGQTTWKRGDMSSTIDYALANEHMLNNFIDMIKDEENNIFDSSDYNLIEIKIKIIATREAANKEEHIEFFSYKEENIKKFISKMLDKFEDNNYTNIEDLNSSIQASQHNS